MTEQKEHSMLNKWALQQRATQVRDIDEVAPIPEDVDDVEGCLQWHQVIQQQIGEKVAEIMNTGLEEYKIRALNDQINILLKQKLGFEKRIRALGGPILSQNYDQQFEYQYFGAAKDLPQVKQFLILQQQQQLRELGARAQGYQI